MQIAKTLSRTALFMALGAIALVTHDAGAAEVKERALTSARVLLSDINGPRGGVDKRCQVELKSDVLGTVVITAVARDWRSAFESALARAAQVLVRGWQRQRQHPRNRMLPIGLDA